MSRVQFPGLFALFSLILTFAMPVTQASAHRLDRQSYGAFHGHHGACNGVYAASYTRKRAHTYPIRVKAGRYVWRTRRLRVGSIRRAGRTIPRYRTVRQRVLVRPVRYRVRKTYGARRWTAAPIVVQGRARASRRHRCS